MRFSIRNIDGITIAKTLLTEKIFQLTDLVIKAGRPFFPAASGNQKPTLCSWPRREIPAAVPNCGTHIFPAPGNHGH